MGMTKPVFFSLGKKKKKGSEIKTSRLQTGSLVSLGEGEKGIQNISIQTLSKKAHFLIHQACPPSPPLFFFVPISLPYALFLFVSVPAPPSFNFNVSLGLTTPSSPTTSFLTTSLRPAPLLAAQAAALLPPLLLLLVHVAPPELDAEGFLGGLSRVRGPGGGIAAVLGWLEVLSERLREGGWSLSLVEGAGGGWAELL